jgi:acyl carrier protein
MENDEIKIKVKTTIIEALELDLNPGDLDENDSLYSGKLGLDSLNIISFLVALEEKFDIMIYDEELRINLFDNINLITEFIHKKLNN